mgnify:CR=1 FL=1
MATDVDVQYFSHLNGLTLDNNWGDLIRLLDKALVTGIDFTQITAASIDEQGDVHITLYAAHNAMLFQVVELSGFTPASLNQKYRIKGVPSATLLILKPKTDIIEHSITTIGTGKLASLGYDIIFRDANDVKRVYRAKDPTAQHPFIRVDETISDGVNSYNSAYAKYAMVGLIENMMHIDDYIDQNKLQLPLDITDFSKNWKIVGTGSASIRGWHKWYWARNTDAFNGSSDSTQPSTGSRQFSICGDMNAFYFITPMIASGNPPRKVIYGCGLYNPSIVNLSENWFLMSLPLSSAAGSNIDMSGTDKATPLVSGNTALKLQYFTCTGFSGVNKIINSVDAIPITPDLKSGSSGLFSASSIAALEIPFYDSNKYIRGNLKHIHYAGDDLSGLIKTRPLLSENSMYMQESVMTHNTFGGVNFYLGEI